MAARKETKIGISVLLVEESAADVEMLLHRLDLAGYEAVFARVRGPEEAARALRTKSWDLVLADDPAPGFPLLGSLGALRTDVPVILTNRLTDEAGALAALRGGARDHVSKDRPERLGLVVRRELALAAERRRSMAAERALRQSEDRYARLLEASSEPTFLCARGNFLYVNRAGIKALGGSSPLDFLGLPVEAFARSADRAVLSEYLEKTAAGQEAEGLDVTLLALGGGTVRARVAAKAVAFCGEPAAQAVCRVERVGQSSRNQTAEAVGAAAEMLAAHFNGCFAGILGDIETTRNSLPAGSPLLGGVEKITRNTERAFRFSQQLLALSQPDASGRAYFSLNRLLMQIEPSVRRLAATPEETRFCFAGNIGDIKADPGQIQNIVLSLVSQARDIAPKGGRLTLQTGLLPAHQSGPLTAAGLPPGEYAVLSISNTVGESGLEEAAAVSGGACHPDNLASAGGCEFATVRALLKLNGGHVWSSHRKGKEASFRVFLPCVRRVQEMPPVSATLPDSKSHCSILLVEGEDSLRNFAALVLRKHGFAVAAAANGAEAIRLCQSTRAPFDIVVTDVCMPEMGGLELAERLWRLHHGLPVLFTSGLMQDFECAPGQDSSRAGFLAKPYTSTDLVRRIKDILLASRA